MTKKLVLLSAMLMVTLAAVAAQDKLREATLSGKGNLAIGWGFMQLASAGDPDDGMGDSLLVWLNYVGERPGRLFVGKIHGRNPSIQDINPKDPALLGLFASYWQGQTERYRLRRVADGVIVELIFDPGEAPPGERPDAEASQILLRVQLQKTTKVSALSPVMLEAPVYRRPLYGTSKPVLSGDDVAFVQALLLPSEDVDGVFGKQTTEAVIKYQAEHGLEADGVVGTITWKALLAEISVPTGK